MPQLQHHPILFGRRTASSFAHFVAGYVCAGYHVDMVSTNAAFLMWLTGLVYALVTPWTVAEQAHIAWILMLCAFCNFFAVATTRFNDSGFTSGLAFWLPPLFLGNFLLLFVGALPTMLVGGCLSGYFVASSQTAPVTLGVASLVALAALFFYDVWAWLPQVGHLGGAGSSEGFDSSYQRAGLLPTAFAVPFLTSASSSPLLTALGLPIVQTAGMLMVMAILACLAVLCLVTRQSTRQNLWNFVA